jgi:hypothetical protein
MGTILYVVGSVGFIIIMWAVGGWHPACRLGLAILLLVGTSGCSHGPSRAEATRLYLDECSILKDLEKQQQEYLDLVAGRDQASRTDQQRQTEANCRSILAQRIAKQRDRVDTASRLRDQAD